MREPLVWVVLIFLNEERFIQEAIESVFAQTYGNWERLLADDGHGELACISHRLTVEARDRPAITSLRLLAVLNVLSEYASARQAARASY